MKKGWGALDGHTCVTHGIQLCVNKFVEEPHIKDCSRAMQGQSAHFSRSTLGVAKLSEIQTRMGLPTSKPSTKSATRWLGLFPQAVWFVQNAEAITEYMLQVSTVLRCFHCIIVKLHYCSFTEILILY